MANSSIVIALILLSSLSSSLAKTLYPYNYCQAPSTVEATETAYKLEFVQTVTRHGDRTALVLLPGDTAPFLCNLTTFMFPSITSQKSASVSRLYRKNYLPGREVITGNCNFGQLTQVGYDQHVRLGQNLRNLYVNKYKFLSPELNTSEIWIRSTDIYRTVQSVQANFIGLYPGNVSAQSSVPVVDMYTMDLTQEDMFPNYNICPRGQDVYGKVVNEPAYVKFEQGLATLRSQLATAFGITEKTLPAWSDIFDAFSVMTCYNIPYPKGITADQVKQVVSVANWEYNYQLSNVTLVKLWIGGFVDELLQRIQDKIAGKLTLKYMHYSGHDTTIAPLTTAFGVYDGFWPPYASHVQIELYSNLGKYYVQVKYQGIAQSMKNCGGTFCPLEQFLLNVKPYSSVDYVKDCDLKPKTGPIKNKKGTF